VTGWSEAREIPGYPGYRATDTGLILSKAGRPMSPRFTRGYGYPYLALVVNGRKKSKPVHCLVAYAFHGPRPSLRHEVAHGDGNNKNSRPDNLRWATHAENGADAHAHAAMAHGERHTFAKLTEAAVLELRSMPACPATYHLFARRFGMRYTSVYHVRRGDGWPHTKSKESKNASQAAL